MMPRFPPVHLAVSLARSFRRLFSSRSLRRRLDDLRIDRLEHAAGASTRARAVLRQRLSGAQLSTGIDPELMQAGIMLAGYHIEAGARKFAEFARAMVADIGEAVRPYLRSFYEGVRHWPAFEDVAREMSPPEEVAQHEAARAAEASPAPRPAPISAEQERKHGIQGTVPAGHAAEGAEATASPSAERPGKANASDEGERARGQVRQLIKRALETPTPEGLEQFLTFATSFRRLAVWNARMAYIQRPGAYVIASEYEWSRVGRHVLPDAVPIIILWPFSPIRFVYELADTGPPINREEFKDPFAVQGKLKSGVLSRLETNLKKQKTFRITIELRRQGFDLAGSAAPQTAGASATASEPIDNTSTGALAHQNAVTSAAEQNQVPPYRVVVNDALQPKEQFVTLAHELGHIFCGHLGGCISPGRKDDESGWPDRSDLAKHEKEIEAESVAYLVAERAGLIARSAEYLRIHAQKADIRAINEDLIVRAASRIERLADIHYGTMSFKA